MARDWAYRHDVICRCCGSNWMPQERGDTSELLALFFCDKAKTQYHLALRIPVPNKPCLTIRHSVILCPLSAVRVVEIEEDTCGTVMARMPSMSGRQPAPPVRLRKPGRAHSLQGVGLQQPRLRIQHQNPQRRCLSERAHRQRRKTRAPRPLAAQQSSPITSIRIGRNRAQRYPCAVLRPPPPCQIQPAAAAYAIICAITKPYL